MKGNALFPCDARCPPEQLCTLQRHTQRSACLGPRLGDGRRGGLRARETAVRRAVHRPSVLNDAPHLPHPWRLSAIPRAFVRVILLCLCDMPYAVASICRCDVARLVPRAACLVARWRVAARVERRRRRRCGRRRRDDSTAAPTLGGRGRSRRASSTSPRSLASASPLGGAAGGGIHVAVRRAWRCAAWDRPALAQRERARLPRAAARDRRPSDGGDGSGSRATPFKGSGVAALPQAAATRRRFGTHHATAVGLPSDALVCAAPRAPPGEKI